MAEYWYGLNCPICGVEGELVIAQDEAGTILLACAECGIGYHDPGDIGSAGKQIDVVRQNLRPATDAQIDMAGWRDLCRFRVTATFPILSDDASA
jgi:uncharacterized Zn finger protein